MAARLRKTHQEDVRAKIQASQLVNVLQDHALGKTAELSASRMKAIEILLRKSIPDLSQVEAAVTGADGGPLITQITLTALNGNSTDRAA
jgi:hypothetical protein